MEWAQAVIRGVFQPPPSGAMARLADRWEMSSLLRDRARTQKQLASWPSVALTCHPCMRTVLLNVDALEILASWWAPLSPQAACVPIPLLTGEAGFKSKTCFALTTGRPKHNGHQRGRLGSSKASQPRMPAPSTQSPLPE